MKRILKSIIRNFIRKPVSGFINLFGLVMSLTLVIILSVYCYSELTTDQFHKNIDRLYLYVKNKEHTFTPGILKDHLESKVPGIESIVRVGDTWEKPVFQYKDRSPIVSEMVFADTGFFSFFSYRVLDGNIETALDEPMSIVITKSLADKLFGNEKAYGQIIKWNNKKELTVTAVIEQFDVNTCFSFHSIASIETRKILQPNSGEYTSWTTNNFQTFIKLKQNVDHNDVKKSIINSIPQDQQKRYSGSNLMNFSKIYFAHTGTYFIDYIRTENKTKILILLLVAVLVMIIALVNFINISSSQWMEKIKQTGVLKVIGARRLVICKGILGESLVLFLAALIIAVLLVNFINPIIQNYIGIVYNTKITYSISFLLIALTSTVLMSLLFSFIPALKIALSKPLNDIKNNHDINIAKISFRHILVIFQFTIVIVLIAFTFLIQKQVDYGTSNFVVNLNNILGIKLTEELGTKKEVFEKILTDMPEVKELSYTQFYPNKSISSWGSSIKYNGKDLYLQFNTFSADGNFFNIMGLELLEGRLYKNNLPSDKNKVIVNEAFLKDHGVSDPIRIKIRMNSNYEIIGVIKDFHYEPVNKSIAPLAIRNNNYDSYCLVGLDYSNFKSLKNSIEYIKKEASHLSPSFPVQISFFDQAVEKMYQAELQFRKTFTIFSCCAIIISCLGIFAMSLFSCQRRIKEIGVRKVNGAKVSDLLVMLNIDFVKWVIIAVVIAIPSAHYVMQKWLENFAYKTAISWWIFIVSGCMALVVALATVSWQSLRTARRNPVEALRYE